MGSAYSTRKLRLVARNGAALRRGAIVIQDALHTATLGDDGGKLFVVRRFSLGDLQPSLGSRVLALEIERRFALLKARAQHAESSGAAHADIVWFYPDEAPIALARALALGAVPQAWFWPLAIGGFSARRSRSAALRLAMRATASARSGPAALAALVERAGTIRGGALFELLAPEDGTELWEAATGQRFAPRQPPEVQPAASSSELALVAPSLRPVLQRWVTRWGDHDPRSHWLSALGLLGANPTLAANPRGWIGRAQGVVAALVRDAVRSTDEAVRSMHDATRSDTRERLASAQSEWLLSLSPRATTDAVDRPSDVVPDQRMAREPEAPAREAREAPVSLDDGEAPHWIEPKRSAPPRRDAPSEPLSSPTDAAPARTDLEEAATTPLEAAPASAPPTTTLARSADTSPMIANRLRAERETPELDEPWQCEGQPTQAAGLLFLIWALRALGLEELLERDPDLAEQGFGARVLLQIAARLRVSPDDPVIHALQALAGKTPSDTPRWRELVTTWANACRRYCRRQARVGLHTVVRRAGGLATSLTHIDATLPLHAVNLRVRVVGLDVDPGWVPWLGRVVLFHYVDGGIDA